MSGGGAATARWAGWRLELSLYHGCSSDLRAPPPLSDVFSGRRAVPMRRAAGESRRVSLLATTGRAAPISAQ